jgi:hypothetical protein
VRALPKSVDFVLMIKMAVHVETAVIQRGLEKVNRVCSNFKSATLGWAFGETVMDQQVPSSTE